MANSFGQLFRITTWGESHGGGVGVVVDGCPPRLKLTEADIQPDLDRRRPGQSKIVTPRKETDTVQILSGTFEGKTLGTPISMWVKYEDARSEAYTEMATKFRPSHADYTYFAKFGIRIGDNTPEELRELVIEMMDRSEGRHAETEQERTLQARFAETAATYEVYPVKMARTFMGRYPDLIQPAPQRMTQGATALLTFPA